VKRFKLILAMLTNAMLLGLIVLVVVDARNPYMRFLTSTASYLYLLLLAVVGVVVVSMYIASLRR
jgi:hypothetical protein